MSDGQPVILRELGGRRREVVLEGAALPDRGIGIGLEQRLVVTHYPGARAASVQMLGTSEQPIRMTGRWSDTTLGLEGGARELALTVRAICLGMERCELQWGDWVRRGYPTAYTPQWHRDGIVPWELTFTPDEALDPEVLTSEPFPVATAADGLDAVDEVDAALDALEEAAVAATAIRGLF